MRKSQDSRCDDSSVVFSRMFPEKHGNTGWCSGVLVSVEWSYFTCLGCQSGDGGKTDARWVDDLVCSQPLQAFWVWMSLSLWASTVSYIINWLLSERIVRVADKLPIVIPFKLQLGWGQMGDSPRWPRRPKKQGMAAILFTVFTVLYSLSRYLASFGEHRNKAAAASKIWSVCRCLKCESSNCFVLRSL